MIMSLLSILHYILPTWDNIHQKIYTNYSMIVMIRRMRIFDMIHNKFYSQIINYHFGLMSNEV